MNLDTFISLIIIGLLIWYKLDDLITWVLAQWPQSVNSSPKTIRYKGRSGRSKPVNALNAGSGHQEARSALAERSSVQEKSSAPAAARPPAGQLPANEQELTQLVRAVTLKAQGATKQDAIEGGFGVSKGGSEGYKRALALFDVAIKGE